MDSADSETIIKYFSEVPFSFLLKFSHNDDRKPFHLYRPLCDDSPIDTFLNCPCVVYCFCSSCYKKAMMIVADNNQIGYEKTLEKSCKATNYIYYENFTLQRKCSYCGLVNCFARIAKFFL